MHQIFFYSSAALYIEERGRFTNEILEVTEVIYEKENWIVDLCSDVLDLMYGSLDRDAVLQE